MKKVVIIGAGIAGLTCGIYAKMSGFETHIIEMHNIPGGECTGWDRGEYHFDGCIHWLTGTREGEKLNEIWRTTGALNDNVKIINHEVFARYEESGHVVNIYTNAQRLEAHLLEISPRDGREIRALCKAIRELGNFVIPTDKPIDMMTKSDGLKFAIKNIRKLSILSRYNKKSMGEFVKAFKDPILQRALLSAIPGDFNANAFVMALAGMNRGNGGFPVGGSRALAKRMEQTYLKLGGKISYNSRVANIMIKEGQAVGVALSDGGIIMGDYIVSCADGYHTLYNLLGDMHTPKFFKNLFENPNQNSTSICAIVYVGVDCEIKEEIHSVNLRREKTVKIGGVVTDTASIRTYAYDESMAPKGKTVIACRYEADYDYWHALLSVKEKYNQGKKQLIDDAVDLLIRRYPQAEGKIEKTNVVTPETFVRYCNAWRGSWMSWGRYGGDVPRYFPGELPGLSNFIMAGMWTMPPGGLPGAAISGRYAAHRLCLKEDMEFRTRRI